MGKIHPFRGHNVCQIVKNTNKVSGCIQKVSMELTFHNNNGIINFLFFDEKLDDMRELLHRLKKSKFWKRKIQYQLSTLQISNGNQTVPNPATFQVSPDSKMF